MLKCWHLQQRSSLCQNDFPHHPFFMLPSAIIAYKISVRLSAKISPLCQLYFLRKKHHKVSFKCAVWHVIWAITRVIKKWFSRNFQIVTCYVFDTILFIGIPSFGIILLWVMMLCVEIQTHHTLNAFGLSWAQRIKWGMHGGNLIKVCFARYFILTNWWHVVRPVINV